MPTTIASGTKKLELRAWQYLDPANISFVAYVQLGKHKPRFSFNLEFYPWGLSVDYAPKHCR